MKKITFILLTLAFLSFGNSVEAQQKSVSSTVDSLINVFRNSVYRSISRKSFWSKSYTSTFTMLKIDINKEGKITDIKFSDSADTSFVTEFVKRSEYPFEKSTLEKYIKLKGYKGISILLPVNYEPFYSPHRNLYYDKVESLIRFDKKNFTGKVIMLKVIEIKVK